MKNIYAFCLAFLLVGLFSCEEYTAPFYEGEALNHFTANSVNYTVLEGDTEGVQVPIGVTAPSNVDRQVTIAVDTENSTAIEGIHFTFPNKTVTIPAGEVVASATVFGEFDGLDEPVTLVLIFAPSESNASFRNTFTINMNRFCPSELEGEWLGTTVLTSPPGTITDYELTLTGSSTNGVYTLSDITGGLYAVGYGSRDNPVQLVDICGVLTVEDQPDVVYGGDVFNATGTVNEDGTLTLSWSNGFGDAGTTTFRRP